ncbi:hypothetical protein O6H91_01G099400 [Diphasiastrum complanatum]|uniref:Uncharacterized protein n=1 Tax=Diphasiastrum complanatum TaxID=34168 RepID=A0ACC2EU40_DIPCM|nr:hypothetical protein O6H91_01G099400 [Diphasiastrum complanatum]
MSLTGVKITEEVWLTCLTHALSTETEEIMGLLLGDIEYMSNGWVVALVWGAAPQTRSDRRKDRVETNPEQLAAASAEADRISAVIGKTTRVIGWYHSHPHITVLPSHVDVRTQGLYQMLDPGFVGLIFSCFSEDGNKVGRIQALAFQSVDGRRKNASPVPTRIFKQGSSQADLSRSLLDSRIGNVSDAVVSSSAIRVTNSIIDLDNNASESENKSFKNQKQMSELEELFTRKNIERERGEVAGATVSGASGNSGSKFTHSESESSELSAGMQEAMHRSNLDFSSSEYSRKEIPLHVVPSHTLAHLGFPLSSLVKLQEILYAEEQAAFRQAMIQSKREGKIHPLAAVHHSATYQASLCKLLEYCLCPALSALWDRQQQIKVRLALLQEEAEMLQSLSLGKGGPLSAQSPRRGSESSPRTKDLHPSFVKGSASVSPRGFLNVYTTHMEIYTSSTLIAHVWCTLRGEK